MTRMTDLDDLLLSFYISLIYLSSILSISNSRFIIEIFSIYRYIILSYLVNKYSLILMKIIDIYRFILLYLSSLPSSFFFIHLFDYFYNRRAGGNASLRNSINSHVNLSIYQGIGMTVFRIGHRAINLSIFRRSSF